MANSPAIPTPPRKFERTPGERNQYDIGYSKGKQEGKREGAESIREIVLDWLEAQYMNKDVKRNTPKAEAILEVTRGLSVVLKEHIVK